MLSEYQGMTLNIFVVELITSTSDLQIKSATAEFTESSNLSKVCKAYSTYCNHKEFSRLDRVRPALSVLRKLALKKLMEPINKDHIFTGIWQGIQSFRATS